MWYAALLSLSLLVTASAAVAATSGCVVAAGPSLQCRGTGLSDLPPLRADLLVLDVSQNNISALSLAALAAAPDLRDLCAEDNEIVEVVPGGVGGADAEEGAKSTRLQALRLARNQLSSMPPALRSLPALELLDLSGNEVGALDGPLPALPRLHTLILKRNRITHVAADAFANTPALRVLRLDENLLTELPAAVRLLPALEDLWVSYNRVESVGVGVLQACGRLARLDLRGNPLGRLHARALTDLPRLHTLVVSEARSLRALPAPTGCPRLRTLRASHAGLARLPDDLCLHVPKLRTLEARGNRLERIPTLAGCSDLRVL